MVSISLTNIRSLFFSLFDSMCRSHLRARNGEKIFMSYCASDYAALTLVRLLMRVVDSHFQYDSAVAKSRRRIFLYSTHNNFQRQQPPGLFIYRWLFCRLIYLYKKTTLPLFSTLLTFCQRSCRLSIPTND